jgi:outer membrane protein OmpA-like peptidoglycan-associated protein
MNANAFKLLCVAALSAASVSLTSLPAAAAETARTAAVLVTPPEPETLADMLFAKRYRDARGSSQPSPRLVEMMIHFDHDSTRILPQSLPLLDSLGQMLRLERTQNESLVIEGHADATGSAAYNQTLSERRAGAIRDYLVTGFELRAERLITVGFGKTRPYDGADPFNPLNRRAAFRPLLVQ